MTKVKTLIVAGGRNHDFEECGEALNETLSASDRISVTLSRDAKVLTSANMAKYDVCVFYTCALKMNKAQQKALLSFVERGGGFVGLHGATVCAKETPALADMIGGTFTGHSNMIEFPVETRDPSHPLLRRMEGFNITDELYKVKPRKGNKVILEAYWRGAMLPIAYTRSYGEGKVFYLALGHNGQILKTSEVRKLITRGTLWAANAYQVQEEDVRVALIGYSARRGRHHAELIESTPGLNIVAVCDEDAERREAAEEDIPGVQLFSDERQLLLRCDFDLAVILFPSDKRTSVALRCLQAKKHVSLEQPMCLSSKQAASVVAAARHGLMLNIYRQPGNGEFEAIRNIVSSGLIGRVFRVEAFAGAFERPAGESEDEKGQSGGILYTMGSPLIQGALELIPEKVSRVSSFYQKNLWHHVTSEDDAQAVIEFESGAVADIHVSTTASLPRPSWRVLGTRGGILTIDDEGMLEVISPDGQLYVPFANDTPETYYSDIASHLHEGELVDSRAEMEQRVITVIEAAERSARNGHPEKVGK